MIPRVMNGAQALIRTLVDGEVTTCFTNPGTSASVGPPGQVATLILPADVSWTEGAEPALPAPPPAPPVASADVVEGVAKAARSGDATALLLGGRGLRADALMVAGRVAAAT